MNDLLMEDDSFLSLDEVRTKYNIQTNFLEYGALINCVKRACNNILEHNTLYLHHPLKSFHVHLLLMDKKGSRRLYDFIISARETKRYVSKWEIILNTRYDCSKGWSMVFLLPFKCTVDTKLRWFQFRLVHRILGVNSFLGKNRENRFKFMYLLQ